MTVSYFPPSIPIADHLWSIAVPILIVIVDFDNCLYIIVASRDFRTVFPHPLRWFHYLQYRIVDFLAVRHLNDLRQLDDVR